MEATSMIIMTAIISQQGRIRDKRFDKTPLFAIKEKALRTYRWTDKKREWGTERAHEWSLLILDFWRQYFVISRNWGQKSTLNYSPTCALRERNGAHERSEQCRARECDPKTVGQWLLFLYYMTVANLGSYPAFETYLMAVPNGNKQLIPWR